MRMMDLYGDPEGGVGWIMVPIKIHIVVMGIFVCDSWHVSSLLAGWTLMRIIVS